MIQSQSPLDSYSLNHTCRSTKKYHPDSKPITIRLLQPQSHIITKKYHPDSQTLTASITYRSTKKYHPDSKSITIRLLQPQSHVAPLRNIILIQSQSPLDSYSLNHMSSTKKYHPDSKSITIRLLHSSITCRSTKKYHPDSKPITIRLLQPQSHIAPLRNIILIQSQSPLDSYSLNHMSLH